MDEWRRFRPRGRGPLLTLLLVQPGAGFVCAQAVIHSWGERRGGGRREPDRLRVIQKLRRGGDEERGVVGGTVEICWGYSPMEAALMLSRGIVFY